MDRDKEQEYKGYRVEGLGTYSMVRIKAKGRGTIPEVLQGLYTSTTEAYKAIDSYLNSLLKKGKKNAPSTQSGTD